MYRVSLIGAGNMGNAMLKGWLESGTLEPVDVIVRDRERARGELLSDRYGVALAKDNMEAAANSEIVVIAVKPLDSGEVLGDISQTDLEGKAILSIVAGLTLDSIRAAVGNGPSLIRVMPNMAALVRAAMSVFAIDTGNGELDREMVFDLLGAIGEVMEVEENFMDLATALSGSGPAYFFLLVEAIEQAGIEEGMPPDISRKLARETLWGAAKVLKETDSESAALRESVSSPGGTTLAALKVLMDGGFERMVGEAVSAARLRAGELAR